MPGSPELAELAAGPVLDVAPRLLGATLRVGDVSVRLTEVEAYDGEHDPGSHAFHGPTARNRVMFGPPGRLYVYFTYGMHHCVNLVCRPEGTAGAVLLRAGEVVDGAETARSRRAGPSGPPPDRDLCRGPARLCRALGLDLADNGLVADIALADEPPGRVSRGPRVGLRQAADRPWRFWITGDPTVSAYRPAKPR